MIAYYFRLALKSFARTPGLTALMASAIALGIAACTITLTLHHAMSANPISWKNGRLFSVTLDSWDPNRPADDDHPELPPAQLTYGDATQLFTSPIPERKVIMYVVNGVLVGGRNERRPVQAATRVTTSDFFAMFDAPFEYGGPWRASDDDSATPVIVISHDMNERLFGGANSVGRSVRWNDREFRIVGVLAEWLPMPRYYDISRPYAEPEHAYVPWGWGSAMELASAGNIQCWKSESLDTYRDMIGSECVWVQMWVELADRNARERMQAALDAYWMQQRAAGRFQRPMNNRLTDVGQWIAERGGGRDDNRVLLALSFAFLAVCLVNTVGLLLAKFLNAAGMSGVRRALGATRRDIFNQHLVEVGLLSGVGALLGLVLAALGLTAVRALYGEQGSRGGYEALAQFEVASLAWVACLAVVVALAAGLYPAWRIGRVEPTVYLKKQ